MASYRRRESQRLAPQMDSPRPTERAQQIPGISGAMTAGQMQGRPIVQPGNAPPHPGQATPVGTIPPRLDINPPQPGGRPWQPPTVTDGGPQPPAQVRPWQPPTVTDGGPRPPDRVAVVDMPGGQVPPGPSPQNPGWSGGYPAERPPQRPWPPVTDGGPQPPTQPPYGGDPGFYRDDNPAGGGEYQGVGGGMGWGQEELAQQWRLAQQFGPQAMAQFMAAHPRFADQYGWGSQVPQAPVPMPYQPPQGPPGQQQRPPMPDIPRGPGWETPPSPGVGAPAVQTPGYWNDANMAQANANGDPGFLQSQSGDPGFYRPPPAQAPITDNFPHPGVNGTPYTPPPHPGQAVPAGGQDFRSAPEQGATAAARPVQDALASAGVDVTTRGRSATPAPQALGLPLSPEFEQGRRALEDELAGTLANLGVAREDLVRTVELVKARIATDLAEEKRQVDESSNARGIYNSGIRTRNRDRAQFYTDRKSQDVGMEAARALREMAAQESGARSSYFKGLAELLMDVARNAATDRNSAVPEGDSESDGPQEDTSNPPSAGSKPPKGKPSKGKKRRRKGGKRG